MNTQSLQPAEGQADCREVRHRAEVIVAENSARQRAMLAHSRKA
jgi:hypothetical protein